MSDSILATKLYIPRQREGAVSRPALSKKILSALNRPETIILISGPAGFGKTSLLAECIAHRGQPTAWLSLDEGDNDPIRFWSYLIKACQVVQPGLGETALSLFFGPQAPALETVADLLINDLAQKEGSLVLVLDDFHALQNPEIHQSFAYFLDHRPANFHPVISTRIDPPLPLARFRARNQLIEIRAAELRFSVEEAAQFLNALMKLNLSRQDVEALEARTEGWAAGLQLAALSMQGRADVSGFIKAFTGSHLFIAEYLVEEVFKSQPADIQSFLLQTSILDRLNAGLCEAVTGCANGQEMLLALKRANLFLLPLDDDGLWFRYHHLFADLLKAHLRQTVSAADISALHARASAWFERSAMESEAIEQALAGGDMSHALQILERIALPMTLQAHVRTVEGWLQAIPTAVLASSPKANLDAAWLYLFRNSPAQAEPYVQRLRVLFLQPDLDPTTAYLQGEWLALQARLQNTQGNSRECIRLAELALQSLPPSNAILITLVHLELATAYQSTGDFDRAAAIFQQIARQARVYGDIASEVIAISGRARMILLQGKLHLTLQVAGEGLDRMQASGKFTPFGATLYGETGMVYFHWHQLDKALENLEKSTQISGRSGYSDPEMYYHIIRSRIAQMNGNWAEADHEMQIVSNLMGAFPPVMILSSVISQQLRVDLALDRLEHARTLLGQAGLKFDPASGLPDLTARLDYANDSGRLFNGAIRFILHMMRTHDASVDYEHLDQTTARVVEDQILRQLIPDALETLLLRSQLFTLQGNEPRSLAEINRALLLAEPEGFISVFVEEGPRVARSLQTILQDKSQGSAPPAFIRQVLAAFPGVPQPAEVEAKTAQPLVESLTNREMEVLQLIAAGDSNQAIASRLFITLSAVKKHTANIYGKLGINSRTQAVALARSLGLLPAD